MQAKPRHVTGSDGQIQIMKWFQQLFDTVSGLDATVNIWFEPRFDLLKSTIWFKAQAKDLGSKSHDNQLWTRHTFQC